MTDKSPDKPEEAGTDEQRQPRVNWDTSQMSSSYANVCNVNSTREEVVLMFGTNERWDPQAGEVSVRLTDRLIMNPYAAKRLHQLLGNIIRQYEERFGALEISPGERGAATQN